MILSVLLKKINEEQKVNGRFEDAHPIVLSLIAEIIIFIKPLNIKTKLISDPATMGISGQILQIPAYKDHVLTISIFIDISGIQEEIHKAFIDPSFCDQYFLAFVTFLSGK